MKTLLTRKCVYKEKELFMMMLIFVESSGRCSGCSGCTKHYDQSRCKWRSSLGSIGRWNGQRATHVRNCKRKVQG